MTNNYKEFKTLVGGKEIVAQELTVNEEMRIMALCDLSTDDAVLEIKTSARAPEQYAEQLFYEARGRKTYLMTMDWRFGEVDFVISEVAVAPGEKPDKRREKAVRTLSTALEGEVIEVAAYDSSTSPVKVRCKECGHEWEETYPRIKVGKCVCPVCHPDRVSARRTRRATGTPRPPREKMTPEQALAKRAQRYAGKVSDRSGGALAVDLLEYLPRHRGVDAAALGGRGGLGSRGGPCGRSLSGRRGRGRRGGRGLSGPRSRGGPCGRGLSGLRGRSRRGSRSLSGPHGRDRLRGRGRPCGSCAGGPRAGPAPYAAAPGYLNARPAAVAALGRGQAGTVCA